MKLITVFALIVFGSVAYGDAPAHNSDGNSKPASSETDPDIVSVIISNAKQIGLACRLYSLDNGGDYPKTLLELFPDYLAVNTIFVCPTSPKEPLGYEYCGGKESDPPKQILLYSKVATPDGKWVVIYNDLSFEVVTEKPKQPQIKK